MDVSEWILLLGRGLLVALIPLALVWARRGSDPLGRLAWVTVFFTFDLVVFGGFTRLTDSGLGCPDWPGCFAKSSPLSAAAAIAAAQSAMPGGPVTLEKAWIEMIHRFLALAVGVLIVLMMLASWWQRRRPGRSPRLASAALGLVCVQGAFGAWTVTQRLQPIVVTTHLLLGLGLLALLTWHALRFEGSRPQGPVWETGAGVRIVGLAALVLLAAQIALGGWVSTNYAVLACPDLPLCRGRWIPEMDLAAGFELWRQLGRSGGEGFISPEALVAIHWVHRGCALIVTGVLLTLAGLLWRTQGARRCAQALLGLLGLQLATGLGNVLLRWPLAIAVLHNGGAAALVMLLVMVNYRLAQASFRPRFPMQARQFAAT